uniref:Uncharacterized protein n=1 Tax=viral metagenome TaxID=1070528 RepID=A0A6M3ITM1_9ZZZZ
MKCPNCQSELEVLWVNSGRIQYVCLRERCHYMVITTEQEKILYEWGKKDGRNH